MDKAASRSDDELMLLARGGIMEAFDELVRRHQVRVLRVAARRLADREMAPDIAQCAFLDLYLAVARPPRGQSYCETLPFRRRSGSSKNNQTHGGPYRQV